MRWSSLFESRRLTVPVMGHERWANYNVIWRTWNVMEDTVCDNVRTSLYMARPTQNLIVVIK